MSFNGLTNTTLQNQDACWVLMISCFEKTWTKLFLMQLALENVKEGSFKVTFFYSITLNHQASYSQQTPGYGCISFDILEPWLDPKNTKQKACPHTWAWSAGNRKDDIKGEKTTRKPFVYRVVCLPVMSFLFLPIHVTFHLCGKKYESLIICATSSLPDFQSVVKFTCLYKKFWKC